MTGTPPVSPPPKRSLVVGSSDHRNHVSRNTINHAPWSERRVSTILLRWHRRALGTRALSGSRENNHREGGMNGSGWTGRKNCYLLQRLFLTRARHGKSRLFSIPPQFPPYRARVVAPRLKPCSYNTTSVSFSCVPAGALEKY